MVRNICFDVEKKNEIFIQKYEEKTEEGQKPDQKKKL